LIQLDSTAGCSGVVIVEAAGALISLHPKHYESGRDD